MGLLYNPLLKIGLDNTGIDAVITASSAPSNTSVIWINSSDNTVYLYYGGSWQSTGIVLTPAAASYFLLEDGFHLLLEDGDDLLLQ